MVVVPTGVTLVEIEATRKFIQRLRRRKKVVKGRADLVTVLNRLRPGAAVADALAEAERQLGAPVAAWLPNAKAFHLFAGARASGIVRHRAKQIAFVAQARRMRSQIEGSAADVLSIWQRCHLPSANVA